MTVSLIKMGFIGTYKIDMLIFIAKILANMELKVIIIDSSKEAYLENYMTTDAYNQVIYGSDIDFYIGQMPEYLEKIYDVALCEYGIDSENIDSFMNCHWKLMITNSEKQNITKLAYISRLLGQRGEKPQLIRVYRDMVTGKIDERYLDFRLLIDSVYNVVASYSFDLEIEDYRYRLHAAYDEKTMIHNQSKQYMIFYQDLMEELLDEKSKTIKKAIRKARREIIVA